MGAVLGRKRKVDWVKDTIPPIVRRFTPGNLVGLWAFGTNPSRKCEDAAQLVALEPAAAGSSAIEQQLASLQPRAARTPVTTTLRAALISLRDPAANTTVILITGASDDCGVDICAAAKDLKAVYPQTKLDVFGLALSSPATEAYTCAAKAMGGGFTAVQTGADLDHLLREASQAQQEPAKANAAASEPGQSQTGPSSASQVVTLNKQGTGDANQTSDAAQDAAAKQQGGELAVITPAPQPEPNVILSAALTTGTPPLEAGVTWHVFKILVTPTGQLKPAESPIWTGGGGQAKIKLAEGKYYVEATYGLATGHENLTVAETKVEKLVPLAAGTITAEALQVKQGPKAEGVFFKLYRRKRGSEKEEVGRSSTSPAHFQVNAGDYIVVASTGLAQAETPVSVSAGKDSNVNLALGVGTLAIKTYAAEGAAKPLPAWHRIFPANGPAKKPVATASGPEHRLQLPEGKYLVETAYGQAVQESTVSITAGQLTSDTVVLNAGEAKIDLGAKADSVCAIYEAGGDHKGEPLGRSSGATVSFFVKAGSYDVECRKKGPPSPIKQTQIRVIAGETQVAKIE